MNRKRGKSAFDDFQKQQSDKRQKKGTGISHVVPEEIIVQQMTPTPSGRLKKYEPLETREFVSFEGFYELSLETIKHACERHYQQEKDSCDVLVGDRGPSCTRIDQIRGKKVYLVRFLDKKIINSPTVTTTTLSKTPHPSHAVTNTSQNVPMVSQFAKSVSLADLLKAGKVQKERKIEILHLQYFDLAESEWQSFKEISVKIDAEPFSTGGFREAFKAMEVKTSKVWIVKKYLAKSKDTMENVLNISCEEHAKKQCQMHIVARNVAQRLTKCAPKEFGMTFQYNRVYFSQLGDEPITVEEYIDGQFVKYVNNDGIFNDPPSEEVESIYKKAETFVHFSLHFSNGKFMIADIQGSSYNLYDPEIASADLIDNDGEYFFCAGNLSEHAILTFKKNHKCNMYCRLLELKQLDEDLD